MSVSMVDCDRCGHPVSDPENPPKIGDMTLCEQCHDEICGNCGKEIPNPEDQYDIPAVGPGTTCPTCTARYVNWMCNGCGTELPEEADQIRIEKGSKFDGTYCSDCAPTARERAEEDPNTKDADPPF